MTETILFAVKIGNPDWDEEVLTEHKCRIKEAMEWGKANGYHKFRIAKIDMDTPPEFSANLLTKGVK